MTHFFYRLGPGILFAGLSIGVSHLVQSTRAGALYGLSLILFILLATLFKYPFFEFAARYTAVTKNNLLKGYYLLSPALLYLLALIKILTMFIVISAVSMVTSGIFSTLLTIPDAYSFYVIVGLFLIASGILIGGKFHLLDLSIKILSFLFVICLFAACIALIANLDSPWLASPPLMPLFLSGDQTFILFIVALMGWMPLPVDLSSIKTLWIEEKYKNSPEKDTLKNVLFDFNVGYIITIITAIGFLVIGSFVFYGNNIPLENKAVAFSGQLIEAFTASLGSWSYPLIAITVFTVIFSTFITIIDGYSRVFTAIYTLLLPNTAQKNTQIYNKSLILILGISLGTLALIMGIFTDGASVFSFKSLIDFAMILSFLFSPITAIINYKLIFNKDFPEDKKPSVFIKSLAIIGILFLFCVSIMLLWIK